MTPAAGKAQTLLHRHWDHDTFRLHQEVVIRSVTAERDVVAIFPIGCGEFIRYQVPAFLLGGLTIVVTQLIALMRDQVDGLSARGMKAISTDHTLSAQK